MTHISERELQLPDAVIGRLLGIAAESKGIISLSVGEPDFVTPKPILDYATKIIGKSTHYTAPSGRIELKEAIIKKLRRDNNLKANHSNILVTCGSQEALFIALLASLDPSEQIVVPNPGYLAYIPASELVSATPVYLKLEESENFDINPDRLRRVINKKKTKAIIINTPSNPTGNVLSRKILEEVADIAVEHDLYIFSDEAYEKLVYGRKHISIGSFNGMQDYVVTFQTFSKSYAMCGFRLGYAVGPEKLVAAMDKIGHYVTLCPPNISQLLGIRALSLNKIYIERMRKEYDKRRKFIIRRLNEIGLVTNMPYGAFYAFSNIKNIGSNGSYEFATHLLNKAKVAVVPGTEFGRYGEGYIRFSYAADMERIKEAMGRLEKFVKNLNSKDF